MKHHLKLLRKRPNKKHLHFLQNPFPIFLLLFFFFFSMETNVFDQHEFTKHSSQPTCLSSVGKILIYINPSVQRGHLSEGREKTPAHKYPPDRAGRRRFRMSLIPLGAGWMLCEAPASLCLYFYLGQQPPYPSCRRAMWSAASHVRPVEQTPFGICVPKVRSLTWAHKGRKMLGGFLVALSMEKKLEIRSIIGHELAGWLC